MPEKIQISSGPTMTESDTRGWVPVPGSELFGFLQATGRPPTVQNRIREESLAILGGCINPASGGRNTGLILGRVQSGKTSSFTATSALAHDNGFKMVIIIAGTTHLLVDQTTERLVSDLRLHDQNAFRRWTVCPISDKDNAKANAAFGNLRARLQAITAIEPPLFAGVPIVVVMKNKTHLDKLNQLLDDVAQIDGVDFSRLPTLIVDDEAHMHSPDVGSDNSPSAVYQCLRELADKFPSRSLLQYTATPQANLLMEIADELSPDFVRILEPGDGYIGGQEIFGTLPNPMVRDILQTEMSSTPSRLDPCPTSLLSATANFLLVCAIDFVLNGQADSRSMLVHSDAKVGVHDVYEYWLTTICESWKMIMEDEKCDIPEVFKNELENICSTRPEIRENGLELHSLRAVIVQVLLALRIQTVNHKRDVGKVNFNVAPYWIINGGNILGVGYTVVGLVTTHMVRKPGAGMADTIQQRGRFFGYLSDRFASVRIFISPTMAKRFQDYSAHEEGLRRSLRKYDASSPEYDYDLKPTLKDWKRVFWLDPAMMPTRKKAQRLMLERARIETDGWIAQRHPSPSAATDATNGARIMQFVQAVETDPSLGWHLSNQWGGAPMNPSTTHLEAHVPLSMIVQLMSGHSMSSEDVGNFFSAVLAIEETHTDLDHQTGLVLLMAQGGEDKDFRRTRSLPVDLFQGRGQGRGQYVGDRKVMDVSRVTLQIHVLNLIEHMGDGDRVVRRDATTLAVRLPAATHAWARNLLQQP